MEKPLRIQHFVWLIMPYVHVHRQHFNCPHLFSRPPLMFHPIILMEFSFSRPPLLDWDPLRFGMALLSCPVCRVVHQWKVYLLQKPFFYCWRLLTSAQEVVVFFRLGFPLEIALKWRNLCFQLKCILTTKFRWCDVFVNFQFRWKYIWNNFNIILSFFVMSFLDIVINLHCKSRISSFICEFSLMDSSSSIFSLIITQLFPSVFVFFYCLRKIFFAFLHFTHSRKKCFHFCLLGTYWRLDTIQFFKTARNSV